MNSPIKILFAPWRFWFVVGLILLANFHGRAQSVAAQKQMAPKVPESRLLLIFDLSDDMKRRLPITERALQQFFMLNANREFNAGDTVGVWTFDSEELRTGQFPLQSWLPENAEILTTNINTFLKHQHYRKQAKLTTVMPLLNRVVKSSPRLTVLIFCDGNEPIEGTPFDAGINQLFEQHRAAQKKSRAAFIIVLRSQLGEYVGSTANFPPSMMSFPQFPPFPQPTNPPPVVVTTNPPVVRVPPPVVHLPPLIIIGTNVGTNVHKTAPVITNPPVLLVKTNFVILPPTPRYIVITRNIAFVCGAVLLFCAGVFAVIRWGQSRRRGRPSLITRSMNDEPPPDKK